jgi:rRNA maturation RNase YbeY
VYSPVRVRVFVKNLQKRIPVNPKAVKDSVLKALSQAKNKRFAEITIFLVNDEKIRKLNDRFRGKNSPTDVIAFDSSINKKEILADIFISVDSAIRNSRLYEVKPSDELLLYAVHGVLHILGYDDKTPQQIALMRKKEKEILSCLSNAPKP